MKNIKLNQSAFTIVELMIASVVFSVILLIITAGVVQIGKSYYKGALQSHTQGASRTIIDEISQGIQFSGSTIVPTTKLGASTPDYASAQHGSNYGFCINGKGYAYVMDKQLVKSGADGTQRTVVLTRYDQNCDTFTVLTAANARSIKPNPVELIPLNMRVTQLELKLNSNGTYTITVEVASGLRDLSLPDTPAIGKSCKQESGLHFCALSKLTTTVQRRIINE